MTEKAFLTRTESAEFLTAKGYPTSPKTLAKHACLGGGPLFRKYGVRVLYEPQNLIAWAEARISKPMTSTSQAQVAEGGV